VHEFLVCSDPKHFTSPFCLKDPANIRVADSTISFYTTAGYQREADLSVS
jgi:hypothetical protein